MRCQTAKVQQWVGGGRLTQASGPAEQPNPSDPGACNATRTTQTRTSGSVVKAMAVVAAQLWPGARLTALVACAFSTHTNSLHGAGTQYGVG